jgi:hypothetical protein
MVQTPPKLLDQLRDKIRLKHYSIRTEEAYADWVRRQGEFVLPRIILETNGLSYEAGHPRAFPV